MIRPKKSNESNVTFGLGVYKVTKVTLPNKKDNIMPNSLCPKCKQNEKLKNNSYCRNCKAEQMRERRNNNKVPDDSNVQKRVKELQDKIEILQLINNNFRQRLEKLEAKQQR